MQLKPRGQDPASKEILSVIEFLKKQVAGERCNSVQVLKSQSPKFLISLANLVEFCVHIVSNC